MGALKLSYYTKEEQEKSPLFLEKSLEKGMTTSKMCYNHDHLGNTRVVHEASWNSTTSQVEYNLKGAYDYFPYGKILRSFTDGNGTERYLTTGHERDHETISENSAGTGLDNRGARFLSIDPKAELFPGWSPYKLCIGYANDAN